MGRKRKKGAEEGWDFEKSGWGQTRKGAAKKVRQWECLAWVGAGWFGKKAKGRRSGTTFPPSVASKCFGGQFAEEVEFVSWQGPGPKKKRKRPEVP